VWMEATFQANAETLTLSASVVALAEIFGEVSIIGLADRFGKKRMAVMGSGIAGCVYVVLPTAASLPVALLLLFMMFFAVEVAIVAGVTIATEVLPDARAVMMSSIAGFASLGRLVGGVLGGLIYALTGSFPLVGVVAMLCGLTGAFLVLRFVHESSR
jgi:predicted MFS family arabinose efflux permease